MIFGSSNPPIDLTTQAWLEFGLQWIAERFGGPRLLESPVIDHDHPAIVYERPLTEERFIELVDFFAFTVGVDSEHLVVDFVDESTYRLFHESELESIESLSEENGDAEAEISAALQNRDPSQVLVVDLPTWIASYSYEQDLFSASPFADSPHVLDELLCLCRGLGPVFAAHSLVTEHPIMMGGWIFDSIPQKNVSLSTIDIGSVLGILQFASGDSKPRWTRKLRPDVRQTLNRMTKYLEKTDSFFGPESLQQKKTQATLPQVKEMLNSGRVVDQIIALSWMLPQLEPDSLEIGDLLRLTQSTNSDLRYAATVALLDFVKSSKTAFTDDVYERMIQLIEDQDGRVKASAAYGLSGLPLSDRIVDTLCLMLHDSDRGVAQAAGYTLRQSKPFVERIVPEICKAISFCVIRGETTTLNTMVETLDEICDHPEEHLVAALDNNEHDFLFAVTDMLRDIRIAKKLGDDSGPGEAAES